MALPRLALHLIGFLFPFWKRFPRNFDFGAKWLISSTDIFCSKGKSRSTYPSQRPFYIPASSYRRIGGIHCSCQVQLFLFHAKIWKSFMRTAFFFLFVCVSVCLSVFMCVCAYCVCFRGESSGPNINSQSLASLSGDVDTPFNLTTTGHQLLLRWASDHGTNRRGFRIRYVGEYQSMYPGHNLFPLFSFHVFWKMSVCLYFSVVVFFHTRGRGRKGVKGRDTGRVHVGEA